jgi:hypothetical protein
MPEALIPILLLCRFIQTNNFIFHFFEHCGYLIQYVTPNFVYHSTQIPRCITDLAHIIPIVCHDILKRNHVAAVTLWQNWIRGHTEDSKGREAKFSPVNLALYYAEKKYCE